MIKQIRSSIFETNSSSTHSLVVRYKAFEGYHTKYSLKTQLEYIFDTNNANMMLDIVARKMTLMKSHVVLYLPQRNLHFYGLFYSKKMPIC